MSSEKTTRQKSKKENLRNQVFELGKLPPQAVDLEEAVLGALMLDKESLSTIISILKPESFYKEAHSHIFKAILELFKESAPVDILTVTKHLKKNELLEIVGGPYYITQLTNRVASTANSEYHSRIIQQKYIQRELIRISTSMIKDCYTDTADVFDLLDMAYTNLNSITSENLRTREKDTTFLFREFITHLEKARLNTEDITGMPCTIAGVNRITNGWQPSDLIVIAARPSMGKTAFLKSCSKGCISRKKPHAIFSLEMSSLQLISRFISEDVHVASQKLLQGKFEKETSFEEINQAITQYYDDLQNGLLIIDDTPRLSITELRAKAQMMVSKYGIKLIMVDYLQLMEGGADDSSDNRVLEISKITRGLKALAKELNIPVIALSQLSRAVEARGGDFRPRLSDLRESGSIEQDADLVGMLYRPEYYVDKGGGERFKTVIYRDEEIPSTGFAELIIEKHRNGALGTIAMRFTDYLTRFQDWDQPSSVAPANPDKFIEPASENNSNLGANTDFLNTGKKEDPFEKPPF